MPVTSHAARLQAALHIHREIASGRYPNANHLGGKLGCSAKTARKYLALLSDAFGVNPIYDELRHGYYYAQSGKSIVPRLNEDEVAAVFILEEASRSLAGSPLQKVLDSVFDKLAQMIPTGCGVTIEEMSHALSLRSERAVALADCDRQTLQSLFTALTKQRRVSIAYEGRERAGMTRRKIDPIHLTRCEGQWYLIAFCHLRQAIRTFVPSRMKDVRVLEEKFTRPKDFDPEAHFRTAFGIAAGMNVGEVALVFDREIAGLIRERRWHVTQQLEELEAGALRLKLNCSQGPELINWIMSWGEQVVVEKPEALAKTVGEKHARAARRMGALGAGG